MLKAICKPRDAATRLALLAVILGACTPRPVAEGGPGPATMPATEVVGATPGATSTPEVAPSRIANDETALGVLEDITATVSGAALRGPVAGLAPVRAPEPAITPRVDAPPIAPDLGNVALTTLLSPEQRTRLAANGFVVSPGSTKEFYELYERARYEYVPIFVTSDAVLHALHLLFDKTLRRVETRALAPMLARLNWEMLRASIDQYEALLAAGDRDWSEAARHNAAFFALAVRLQTPDWQVPRGLRDLVEPDLRRILDAQGDENSTIVPDNTLDWTQFTPRGHYTQNDTLRGYFRAMMWQGLATLQPENDAALRQAALLSRALSEVGQNGRPLHDLWKAIYEPTVFLIESSDDLLPTAAAAELKAAYRDDVTVERLADGAAFERFRSALQRLPGPRIGSGRGLRFMGQRFVPDAYMFDQLMHDRVRDRGLPRALDVMAVLGSERALAHLEEMGETRFAGYREHMVELRAEFAGLEDSTWLRSVYWSWIDALRPLLAPPSAGHPQFMRSPAWLDKQLTTALGSWTELKRDTVLYAKQASAERGGGGLPPPAPEPPKGYVEPVPILFARIVDLARRTMDGLGGRGLLDENDRRGLEDIIALSGKLQVIAEKELAGEPPNEEEYKAIRFIGAELEAITMTAADDNDVGYGGANSGSDADPQVAVIADVATGFGADISGSAVLEEGLGRVFPLYVVVPIEGRLVLTKGGVLSHYEFAQPAAERLTDEAWRERLGAGKAPPLADWTASYVVAETVDTAVAAEIVRFAEAYVRALWLGQAKEVEPQLSEPALSGLRDEIMAMGERREFQGQKLLDRTFLSFDFQDEDHVTVAARERWEGTRYAGAPGYRSGEPEVTGRQAPHEQVVTYTLERRDGGWKVSRRVPRPGPPEWGAP
jgi:hypothetical protein